MEKNILVPKHEILEEADAEEVLESFKVTLGELPKINKNDSALKDMPVKVGSIIKITRKSPTAGESIYYRVVTDD
ncbi:MAG: DNA-directed RNA polymerase subunit H [Candidatus Altiarchaeota archaeon]|nr:DNA-directed RNA polymerase subunit H [Candidatus Altiarchaeota archaeon]